MFRATIASECATGYNARQRVDRSGPSDSARLARRARPPAALVVRHPDGARGPCAGRSSIARDATTSPRWRRSCARRSSTASSSSGISFTTATPPTSISSATSSRIASPSTSRGGALRVALPAGPTISPPVNEASLLLVGGRRGRALRATSDRAGAGAEARSGAGFSARNRRDPRGLSGARMLTVDPICHVVARLARAIATSRRRTASITRWCSSTWT